MNTERIARLTRILSIEENHLAERTIDLKQVRQKLEQKQDELMSFQDSVLKTMEQMAADTPSLEKLQQVETWTTASHDVMGNMRLQIKSIETKRDKVMQEVTQLSAKVKGWLRLIENLKAEDEQAQDLQAMHEADEDFLRKHSHIKRKPTAVVRRSGGRLR